MGHDGEIESVVPRHLLSSSLTPADSSLVLVALQSRGTPFPEPLTYLLPDQLRPQVRFGSVLLVPLGGRELIGAAVGFPAEPPPDLRLRSILAVLDPAPACDQKLYRVAESMAHRYS